MVRKTCAGCPHLATQKMVPNGVIPYCKETGLVVPHNGKGEGHEWKLTFWRIPMSCPLPSDEVLKSEKQAPRKEWVTLTMGARASLQERVDLARQVLEKLPSGLTAEGDVREYLAGGQNPDDNQ